MYDDTREIIEKLEELNTPYKMAVLKEIAKFYGSEILINEKFMWEKAGISKAK